jgi:hypothetical protein
MKFTRLFNVFKGLRDIGTAKTEHTPSITQAEHMAALSKPPEAKRTAKFSKAFLQKQQPLDFNLTEALCLRNLGWGNRRIARQMNNVSRETVPESSRQKSIPARLPTLRKQ